MPSGKRPHSVRPPRGVQHGFAYLLLLITIGVLGLAASANLSLGATTARRDAERELLAVGAEFERALRAYAGQVVGTVAVPGVSNVPGMAGALGAEGPKELEDLLRDPRSPGLRRHLRRIPHDPLTGRQQWGLVRDEVGSINGVYSLAPGRPIRQAGFDPQQAQFAGAQSYGEWVFGPAGWRPARMQCLGC